MSLVSLTHRKEIGNGAPVRMAATQVGDEFVPTVNLGGSSSVVVSNGASFSIPPFDSQEFTYVSGGAADDDLIATQVFKNGGTTVATLTYAYAGATNNITSITQT